VSAASPELHSFAYGERLEGVPERSLGYGLLAPAEREPWAAEVEALARRLQTAPYPDVWPPVELFCSVLLAGGQRLIAAARYGLVDHTASQRRGGLELVGVIGPSKLGPKSALAIYRWLRRRRHEAQDLRAWGGRYTLVEILSASPPSTTPVESAHVSSLQWQDGILSLAAVSPENPDERLGLLEGGLGDTWQWLPLVGPDFPLKVFARRGPLVAWTPHPAGARREF
jgi:hypothetical protein